MVIQSVSKPHAHELHAATSKARRPGDDANSSGVTDTQESRALNLQSPDAEISNENEAVSAVEWLRTHIVNQFHSAVAVQGNLDPLRVAHLLEA